MVSGDALAAVAREMTPELDQVSAAQDGLQPVVAAALAQPTTPLAISVRDDLIQAPLRQCVQCPLLWGLRRAAGPLLGPAGRGWSFSTFELALGETDPTSLPAIVFRETRDWVKAPPSRWRKEAKVRPFESGTLDDGTFYAEMIDLAGWLVAQYRERGGDGLEQLIADRAGSAGSSAMRIERILDTLPKPHHPPQASQPVQLPVPDGPLPPEKDPAEQEPAEQESLEKELAEQESPEDELEESGPRTRKSGKPPSGRTCITGSRPPPRP